MSHVIEYIETLRRSSDECIDNGAPVTIPEAMAPGDMLPQGDVGLLMLESLPPQCSEIDCPDNGQLAPGTSKGSRHCIPEQYWEHLTFYRVNDGNQLSDLAIDAKKSFDLTHPEHADHLGYPPGIYRVHHQQDEQRMRVID